MKTLLLSPTESGVGLTSVCLGTLHALDQMGLRIVFFKPIAHQSGGEDRSISLVQQHTGLNPPAPIPYADAESLIGNGQQERLLEDIISLRQRALDDAKQTQGNIDVLIVEGIHSNNDDPVFSRFNSLLARALDAMVILIATPQTNTLEELHRHLEATANQFGGINDNRVLGCIINMLNAPLDRHGRIRPDIMQPTYNVTFGLDTIAEQLAPLRRNDFDLVGAIPWNKHLTAPRTKDVADFLNAKILHEGELSQRRVMRVIVAAQRIGNLVQQLQPGTLVITPADRDDVIIATALAQTNGVALAGLLLTQPLQTNNDIKHFCRHALSQGLPVMEIDQDCYQMINLLPEFNNKVPIDDVTRVRHLQETVAQNLDKAWLANLLASERAPRISPAAFRYSLVQHARRRLMKIILPEGNEPRTIRAAISCHHRKIAQCLLMGDPAEIKQVATAHGEELPDGLEIIDPAPLREQYVDYLLELRQHKGLTPERAAQELEDNVVLGTIMLKKAVVDGLVSGAVHTTANTIRPALQLIKTKPGVNIVSSIFFMCLPDQVVVYGDCAINPDPDAEQLADIAIESADSARNFGIEARMALISYSTGQSGSGTDVDKVRQATEIVARKRPDLVVDGPLQFDAAVSRSVAAKKAPDSPVAGDATVLIFPDLNTGNTTYKAVQRSANVISIGPMLQGLNKPVNDLSRGAKVDDIIYTIALTAIQAQKSESE
ncbi:phosphate acetyltransferase [Ketobacter sp. MCCC 1A13808]|uniref:phosphate acetyltransferase n=1 Tax=Ketobacter sp. MCCC 1A13808 TaxID=2602738 RepID=UPI0012EB7F01|nr:phosphate acetyltransferase [Ketobacter sp. MCCC 1A13808]MVF11070.1 phosphate acetyltransferase [Ketobacter sp. MCCC 1A13808]